MFQTTRRRLALWYTAVTAVLLIFFATGVYVYVRNTLVERVDDTLNHVVEVVQRSLVIEAPQGYPKINVEDSFRDNPVVVEDDHIDLEWFSPNGARLWSTLTEGLPIVPLHPNIFGETIQIPREALEPLILRQITQPIRQGKNLLGYLRVSEPWFEVTIPTRELVIDLLAGTTIMVGIVAAIGWFLSGLAMTPIRDSYQRLKQFTADASHELRNPIAVIQTNVQVALADPEPNAKEQQQHLQVIERLTRRLGRLVEDLLFLARQDSNTIQLSHHQVVLAQLLSETLEEQLTIANDKQITLDLDIPTALSQTTAQINRDQISRVLTNLIGNALQHTPPQGHVSLALAQVKRSGQPYVQIKVTDTGRGIPAEAIPQLFERFYRVDPARSKSSGGTGLGLAIAKAIIDNHQGHIQVESQINQGTIVTIMLPQQALESPT
ncbi:sensor histidine kinase [filamentous cyanobacterium LEGE 11480]|uniref:histidine kinase n=1 Tax=Romeriopsis navalis LEGE 11480 TaxID=2777977 RepID=A0A928Z567_9CYAN|nr:ATP-binding protein [Romeriopsis navalis]MBE9030935.1 sensor histidine kinase [Romeriopsis navalis LEGE 11480]